MPLPWARGQVNVGPFQIHLLHFRGVWGWQALAGRTELAGSRKCDDQAQAESEAEAWLRALVGTIQADMEGM